MRKLLTKWFRQLRRYNYHRTHGNCHARQWILVENEAWQSEVVPPTNKELIDAAMTLASNSASIRTKIEYFYPLEISYAARTRTET